MKVSLGDFKTALTKVASAGHNQCVQITFEANKLCLSMVTTTISIFAVVDAKCDDAPFDIMVDYGMLSGTINRLSGNYIALEKNNNVLLISTEPGDNYAMMRLPVIQAKNKPDSKVGEEYVSKINVDYMQEYTKACVHAAATATRNDARMESFYIEDAGNNKLRITALDGYRVSIRDSLNGATPNTSVMVSAANMNNVATMIGGPIKIAIPKNGRFVRITGNNTVVVMPTVDGSYYNVDQLLNRPGNNPITIKVNRERLMKAIDIVALVNPKIALNIGNGKISLFANNVSGEAKCDVPYMGDKDVSMEIGFNAKYLADALKNIGADNVEMSFTGAINPCVITSSTVLKKNGNEVVVAEKEVVLPVRIKG